MESVGVYECMCVCVCACAGKKGTNKRQNVHDWVEKNVRHFLKTSFIGDAYHSST